MRKLIILSTLLSLLSGCYIIQAPPGSNITVETQH